MAKCKCCGGTVWSGVVLHTHCLEQLQPVWHPGDEKPPTHIEIIRIDDDDEPVEISGEFLCETESGRFVVARFDGETGEWFCDDGSMPKVYRWMHIEE